MPHYMNLLEQDLPWLTAEGRNDPDTAQQIIEALAGRVQQLQQQADELRTENVLLKRSGSHQVYHDQVQRLKTDLRDLRGLAERHNLNPDVISIVSFTGSGMQIPAPLPIDQTLTLATAEDEPIRDIKPVFMAGATRLDSLLAITSSFRLVMANGLGLPTSDDMRWTDARPIGGLVPQRGERIEALCAANELQPPRRIAIATRQGWVRILSWALVENLVISGQSLTPPNAGDTPVWLGAAGDGDLLLITRNGRWTRFPVGGVDPAGSFGIALDADDDVACAAPIESGDGVAYCIGADGAQLAVACAGLEAHRRPGAKPAPLARRFIALACFIARKSDAVMLLSNGGDLIVETLRALPIAARPGDAQPLNLVSQRLLAAAILT
jgi:DNA gyrase/topoisomerase IV subunit A